MHFKGNIFLISILFSSFKFSKRPLSTAKPKKDYVMKEYVRFHLPTLFYYWGNLRIALAIIYFVGFITRWEEYKSMKYTYEIWL